jgi:hypothetical protein
MARPWSKAEVQAFLDGVGTAGISWLRFRGGAPYSWPNAPKRRSRAAVYAKARRLYGGGGIARGSYAIAAICRTTGYSRTHLRRAMSALAQKWRRTSPRGRYIVYEDQLEELTAWLAHDYWSKTHRLHVCLWCGLAKRPHGGQGLCVRCYQRYTRALSRAGLPRAPEALCAHLKAAERPTELAGWPTVDRALQLGRAMPEPLVGKVIEAAYG